MRLLSLLFTVVVSVVALGQVPTITSFSPTSGPVGTSVTISGTGFSTTAANNLVYFGAVKATVSAATSTSLTVAVPAGATYNTITVTNLNDSKQTASKLPFNPTWNNSNPGTVTSSSYSLSEITSSTTPASVNSGSWSSLRHNQEVADIDGDGKPDLIMVDNANSKVRVIRNISSPGSLSASSFSSTTYDFSTVSSPLDITSGDLNNDGKIDLIISNNSTNIGVLINNSNSGTPSFLTNQSITMTNSSVIVKLADIDCDGKLDLLASPRGGAISCYRNTSSLPGTSISFAASVAVGMNSMDISIGDLNLDGKVDVISSLPGGNIGICQNSNSTSGTISLATSFNLTSQETYSVGIVDINNDGKLDIVGGGTWTTSGVCFQNNHSSGNLSSSSFGSSVVVSGMNSSTSQYTWNLNFGDINGDGKPEFGSGDFNSGCYVGVVTNNVANSSTITTGSLVGTHYLSNYMGSYTNTLIVDLDLDGKADYATFSNNKIGLGRNVLTNPISASPNSLSGFSTCAGTVSAAQTTSVSGTGLSANITLTAPTGYEISLSSGSGYASTLTLTQSGGVVNATTIYVRLNSIATAGTYNANLTAVSGSNTTNIALAGVKIGNPTLTTNPTTTLEQYCYSNPNTTSSITVATSAASPTYQWQISSDNSNFSNVVNGTGGTAATYFPSHVDIMYGNTRYYRCIVTSACGSTTSNSKPFGIYSGLTASAFPSTADQVYCTGATAAALNVNYSTLTNWPTLNYQWKESTDLSTWVDVTSGTGGTTASYTPSTAVIGTKYYRCSVSGTCGSTSTVPSSGAITVKAGLTWNGSTSNDPSASGNWTTCGSGTGTDFNIPAGVPNYPEYTNLTISAGQTVTVESGARLTVNGILTNDGTLIINSGATLVQGSTSTIAGSGNYIVKQIVSGIGQIVAPAGRFWYLGSPVTTATSSVFFTNLTTNNTVVKKRNESTNSWTQIASGTPENLEVGRGYYAQIRPVASSSLSQNVPLTFSGTINNNPTSSALTINCTRTTGQGFEGFNLVSNPYPSYLDWDLVTKTNVGNTMWYRTATGTASNTMVFETYVAGAAGGIGTNLSGNVATKLIPPMQAFWVRVNSGNSTGSIVLDNSMRAHFTSVSGSTAGLRSTNDELKVFLRMNLLQEDKKDQLIVYMNGSATNGFDILDGEKMMQAGFPQFYTQVGDKKIVINGLNSAKKQQSLPVTVELPTTGVHTIQVENLDLEAGLVWLEDAQEGTMNVLNPGFNYEFYGEAGINTDRFVLHFNILDNSTPAAPNYGEVNSSANFSGKGANVHAEAAGVVVIKLPASTEGVTDIQIRDAAGRIVYTGSTNTLETSVQLSQANGIYYVTLNSNAGVEVRKVFIQQ
jgi:hypothetical protein